MRYSIATVAFAAYVSAAVIPNAKPQGDMLSRRQDLGDLTGALGGGAAAGGAGAGGAAADPLAGLLDGM